MPDERPFRRHLEPEQFDAPFWLAALVIVLVGGAVVLYLRHLNPDALPPPGANRAAVLVRGNNAVPAIQHPLETPESSSLPELAESDGAIWKALTELFKQKLFAEIFYPDRIIRRIVATVDNLSRSTVPVRLMPVAPVQGKFVTERRGVTHAIAPGNSARYRPYVRLAQSIDARKLVDVYMRFYPLFQKAYTELGYTNGYFNDRLFGAIDDLLNAPVVAQPVRLTQPQILYQFEAKELEARSAGQKIMMRIGHDNEIRIKAKLREIRAVLVARAAKQ